jgi:hypothetical protein
MAGYYYELSSTLKFGKLSCLKVGRVVDNY